MQDCQRNSILATDLRFPIHRKSNIMVKTSAYSLSMPDFLAEFSVTPMKSRGGPAFNWGFGNLAPTQHLDKYALLRNHADTCQGSETPAFLFLNLWSRWPGRMTLCKPFGEGADQKACLINSLDCDSFTINTYAEHLNLWFWVLMRAYGLHIFVNAFSRI